MACLFSIFILGKINMSLRLLVLPMLLSVTAIQIEVHNFQDHVLKRGS